MIGQSHTLRGNAVVFDQMPTPRVTAFDGATLESHAATVIALLSRPFWLTTYRRRWLLQCLANEIAVAKFLTSFVPYKACLTR